MRENNIVELVALSPFNITRRRICLALGMRMIVRKHFAIILIDIKGNMQQYLGVNLRKIIAVFGSIGGRVVFDYLAVLTSRSEEHTSELQSRFDLVCRLL